MKKIIVASGILLSLFLSTCSTNYGHDNLSIDNSSYNNSSNTSNDSSDSQKHQDDEDFLIYCLPQEFYYDGMYYEMETGIRLEDSDITDFFGYFINLEDLEKWKEKENSNDIIYVIDNDNSIYHYDLTGELANRFELYSTHNENEIALKAYGDFLSYKTKGVLK